LCGYAGYLVAYARVVYDNLDKEGMVTDVACWAIGDIIFQGARIRPGTSQVCTNRESTPLSVVMMPLSMGPGRVLEEDSRADRR
jgi:hypothetical protein